MSSQELEQSKQIVSPGDILRNALVFRGCSTAIYQSAAAEVRNLLSLHRPLYPPQLNSEGSRKGVLTDSTITISTTVDETGLTSEISPAEAVAISVLQKERLGLDQAKMNPEAYKKVKEMMGISSSESLDLAIQGVDGFIDQFGLATTCRTNILSADRGELEDELDETEEEIMAIRQDQMVIGENTVASIIKEVEEYVYETEGEMVNTMKGAKFAAALYLEVLALASREFPTTLEREVSQGNDQEITLIDLNGLESNL